MPDAPPGRVLAPHQICRVYVYDLETGSSQLVLETDALLLEAPNWTTTDELILNGDGTLWSLRADGTGTLTGIEIDGLPPLNNDHVLDPDGEHIFVSAGDWQIYRVALAGGTATRVTDPTDGLMHFLHGVSPNGRELAYVGLIVADEWDVVSADIRIIGADGRGDRALTSGAIADGPEFSPDGAWIYFNTEAFASVSGHAQIARVRPDGSGLEQLTFDDRVNWFPHLAPVGGHAVYISFPPGTEGHPADREVHLVLVDDGAWTHGEIVATLPGGQGTINVNSWSPNGRKFAYVSYPFTSHA